MSIQLAAVDEDGAERIVSGFVTGLSDSKSDSAYGFSYNISWEFIPGDFELVPAGDIIRLSEWHIHTDISFGWECDLNNLLKRICIPEICVDLPFIGTVCSGGWCLDWPTISVTVSLPTFISEVSVDFSVKVEHDIAASQWVIKGAFNALTTDIDIIDLADTAKRLFEDTLGDVLSGVPYIGPYLEDVIEQILDATLDSIDDLDRDLRKWLSESLGLHPVLSIGFELHRVDEIFEILPASGPEPPVTVRITDIDVEITSDKELVVRVDIAVP